MCTYADNIKNLVPAGSRIDFKLCHVSRSHLTRDIALFYTKKNGELCDLSYNVAGLMGLGMKNQGVRISGAGQDMVAYLIREMGQAVYDDAYAFTYGYQAA